MATTRPSRTTKRWHCSASPLLWIILGLTSSLLLGLSYWQLSKGLHRLSEDQAQLKLAQKRATPYTIEESFIQWQQHPTSIQDSKVILDGQLQQSILLLHDNRILDGKAGYGIYGLLELPHTIQIAEYTHILVQIGWHPIPLFKVLLF